MAVVAVALWLPQVEAHRHGCRNGDGPPICGEDLKHDALKMSLDLGLPDFWTDLKRSRVKLKF